MQLFNHPDFESKDKLYKLFEDIFQGDHDTLVSSEYLPYHELETRSDLQGVSKVRQTREKLSHYTNFPSRGFRRYQSIIFQTDPSPDKEAKEFLEKYKLIDNIDGFGTNVFEFIKGKLFKDRFRFGDSALLTTSQDNQPIWDSINPRSVRDWSFQNGKLILFRYEYYVQEARTSSASKPQTVLYSDEYSLVGKDVLLNRYKAKDSKAKQLDWELTLNEKITNFTGIPVALLLGDSFLKDCSNDVLTYHNLKSSLLNVLYHQAFQKIIITGAISKDQQIAFAEYVATILRTDDGGTANVTNIEPSNPTALINQVNAAEMSVYKSMFHLNRMLSSDSGNTESQQNQQEAKQDLLNMIKSEVNSLERQVNKGLQHLAIQAGVKNFKGSIAFDKNISIQTIDEALRDEMAYREDAKNYPTWNEEQLKKAVARQEYSPEKQELIFKEIEAGAKVLNSVVQPAITLNNA